SLFAYKINFSNKIIPLLARQTFCSNSGIAGINDNNLLLKNSSLLLIFVWKLFDTFGTNRQ
ncbi:MAG: hypothetical protein WCE54_09530, partial [Ignavibacteriaceae bacterium]